MRETFKKFTCNVLLLCPFEKTNRTNNSNKIKKSRADGTHVRMMKHSMIFRNLSKLKMSSQRTEWRTN